MLKHLLSYIPYALVAMVLFYADPSFAQFQEPTVATGFLEWLLTWGVYIVLVVALVGVIGYAIYQRDVSAGFQGVSVVLVIGFFFTLIPWIASQYSNVGG